MLFLRILSVRFRGERHILTLYMHCITICTFRKVVVQDWLLPHFKATAFQISNGLLVRFIESCLDWLSGRTDAEKLVFTVWYL